MTNNLRDLHYGVSIINVTVVIVLMIHAAVRLFILDLHVRTLLENTSSCAASAIDHACA